MSLLCVSLLCINHWQNFKNVCELPWCFPSIWAKVDFPDPGAPVKNIITPLSEFRKDFWCLIRQVPIKDNSFLTKNPIPSLFLILRLEFIGTRWSNKWIFFFKAFFLNICDFVVRFLLRPLRKIYNFLLHD